MSTVRLVRLPSTETGARLFIMRCLILGWLTAQDAVDAGADLADSFRAQTTGQYIREFLDRATHELRARQLSFYKRVRFANAFKWRLLEKEVTAETAHHLTQTLLINIGSSAATASAPSPAIPMPVTAIARTSVSLESLDSLFEKAAAAADRGAYVEAVALYLEYTAGRPKHARGFNNLGAVLTRLGR